MAACFRASSNWESEAFKVSCEAGPALQVSLSYVHD